MKEQLRNQMLAQLDAVINMPDQMGQVRSQNSHDWWYATQDMLEFIAAATAVVERVAGSNSPYARLIESHSDYSFSDGKPDRLLGVLMALRRDVEAGYLDTLAERVHADVFSDFLEQADYLQTDGFKDSAAVLAGGVLENHLRQLAIKHSVDVERTAGNGDLVPKKAEELNTDLVKAGVYEKLDQKNVTAWLDLRNKAAHARYGEYDHGQVALLIQSVRDFLTRHPA